jgi:hypothetical protein
VASCTLSFVVSRWFCCERRRPGLSLLATLLALVCWLSFPALAQAQTAPAPGGSIATATTFVAGDSGAGGGTNAVDYWKTALGGGEQIEIGLTPSNGGVYHFELYPSNTTSVASNPPLSSVQTAGGSSVTLWAPYTGNFILAVCEASGWYSNFTNCGDVAPTVGQPSGNAVIPMSKYTFETAVAATPTGAEIDEETVPSQTISDLASAPDITIPASGTGTGFEAGGGHAIDYWNTSLGGGEQIEIGLTPSNGGVYHLELYPSNTTSVASNPPLSSVQTAGGSSVTLWAPYTGNFILAVCEASGWYSNFTNCGDVAPTVGQPSGNAVIPMSPYTFSTAVAPSPDSTQIAAETVPSPSITALQSAPDMSFTAAGSGTGFEAGGGHTIDYWNAQLVGGDQVSIGLNPSNGGVYHFELYPSTTTDSDFASTSAVSATESAGGGSVTLSVPSTGSFILAVCEASGWYSDFSNCGDVVPTVGAPSGNAVIPMSPYTFSTSVTQVVDPTSTSVACSPDSIGVGSATTCAATVTDTASSGASTPSGTVSFSASPSSGSFGSSGSCTLTGTGTTGVASCQVTFTPAAGGSYTVTGAYGGDAGHGTSSGQDSSVSASLDPTSTGVACSPESVTVGSATTCTATVTDTASSGGTTPTGTVTFSTSSSGSFGGHPTCTLAAAGAGVASCHVRFTPSTSGSDTITGDYSGDSGHSPSSGDDSGVKVSPQGCSSCSGKGKPGAVAASSLSIARQIVTVAPAQTGTIAVDCGGAPCTGTITLTALVKRTVGRGRHRRVKRVAETIGSAAFSGLAVGGDQIVVKLNQTGLRLLERGAHQLTATAVATYKSGTKTESARATVSLHGVSPSGSAVA